MHGPFYWNCKLADLLKAHCYFWRSLWPVIWLQFTFIFVIYFPFTPLFLVSINREPQLSVCARQGDQPAPALCKCISEASRSPWCLLLFTTPQWPPWSTWTAPGSLQVVSSFSDAQYQLGQPHAETSLWPRLYALLGMNETPRFQAFWCLSPSWKLN